MATEPRSVSVEEQLRIAATFLKSEGCAEVYVCGSTATGRRRPGSDIDIAVRGCPRGRFFELMGKLMLALDRDIDLIDLDRTPSITPILARDGGLRRIA